MRDFWTECLEVLEPEEIDTSVKLPRVYTNELFWRYRDWSILRRRELGDPARPPAWCEPLTQYALTRRANKRPELGGRRKKNAFGTSWAWVRLRNPDRARRDREQVVELLGTRRDRLLRRRLEQVKRGGGPARWRARTLAEQLLA